MLDYISTKEIIYKSRRVLIIGHIRPDGDAISSCLALSYLLNKLQKEYELFCLDNIPPYFNYLKDFNKIKNKKKEVDFKTFDLVITADCGSLARTGCSEEIVTLKKNNKIKLIEIDHHLSNDSIADIELRDPSKAATTELIYELCQTFNFDINKDTAEAILTGLITDTANFFYPNASASTISLAAKLLNKGANLNKIVSQVKKGNNIKTLKLWGLAMERLSIHQKYNFAYSVLSKEDLKVLKIEENELNETLSFIAGFLSNLANVKATLLLYDSGNGMVKGHLRSANKSINVAKLANYLGGGGHSQAAGFIIKGELIKKENTWEVI
jgi:bifunctional oligoribonuclease and PAP phosphatase NrnA